MRLEEETDDDIDDIGDNRHSEAGDTRAIKERSSVVLEIHGECSIISESFYLSPEMR